MAISVYDWGSVLEQLQAGNQEFKPNFSKAMKIKSQIASQELKRETRWWYRLRRQRGSGGCVCMRVFVIKICVAVCECTCHWKGGALLLVFFSEVYCTIAPICTVLLYYCTTFAPIVSIIAPILLFVPWSAYLSLLVIGKGGESPR